MSRSCSPDLANPSEITTTKLIDCDDHNTGEPQASPVGDTNLADEAVQDRQGPTPPFLEPGNSNTDESLRIATLNVKNIKTKNICAATTENYRHSLHLGALAL